jgi:predicted acyltransferase
MADTYKVREDPLQGKPSTEVKPAGKLLKDTPKPVRPPGTAPEERKLLAERAKPRDPGRLVSLDAYRGFIMFVLAASGFGIAAFAAIDPNSPVWEKSDYDLWQKIAFHFEHPDWRSNFVPSFLHNDAAPDADRSEFLKFGVSFWDLIQPAFMFMVGVAMPFSYARRAATGQAAGSRLGHALWRAIVLVLLGVFLYSIGDERTDWIFPNVLAQIGLGYFFVYLLLGRKLWLQLTVLVLILAGYWAAFKFNPPPQDYNFAAVNASAERGEVYEGAFAPWSKNANAAHFFDFKFLNLLRTVPADEQTTHNINADAEDWAPDPIRNWFFANSVPFLFNGGGYQTLNFIPSMATMLLGLLCGQLLLAPFGAARKLGILVGAGCLCLLLGLVAAEWACPIVKRIWTPSWVLFSGAYVIWMLAGFYFLFDILPFKLLALPLVVVGMNSIAIYLMGELIRGWTIDNVIRIHLTGILQSLFGVEALAPDRYAPLIFTTAAGLFFWLVCWWMYRRKIFIRI